MDGRLGYVFTRQPSIKSMNFLDLGGRGRLEDDKLVKERGRPGRHVGSWAVIAQIPGPTIFREIQVGQGLSLAPFTCPASGKELSSFVTQM